MGYLPGDTPTITKQILLIGFAIITFLFGGVLFVFGMHSVLIYAAYAGFWECVMGFVMCVISYHIVEYVMYPENMTIDTNTSRTLVLPKEYFNNLCNS